MSKPLFVFDVETTGLNYQIDVITSFSFYDSELGFKTDKDYQCVNITIQLGYEITKRLLTHTFVAHNIKFDLHMVGITPDAVDLMDLCDTTVLYHYNYPRDSKSLGDIETHLFGTSLKNGYLEQYGKDFTRWPNDVLGRYNETDVYITKLVYKELKDKIPTDFLSYQNKLIKAIYRIEYNGFPFDLQRANEVEEEFKGTKQLALEKMEQYLAKESLYDKVNYNSSKQVSKLLYEDLGIEKPDRYKYPKGKNFDALFTNTLTNAKLLKTIDHPFVKMYLDYKAIQSTLTFINTYKELETDGRLYPSFNVTGTITGRLSCSKPNLQNIKKKSVDEFSPRKLFIPEKGETLVSIDYQQQEIRMLAVLSGDRNLLELVRLGTDMHTAVGCKMLGKPELLKEERDIFKDLHFGMLYGLSIPALAWQLNKSEWDTDDLVKEYYNQFPDVHAWMEATKEEVAVNGCITLWTGRRWYSIPGAEYQGINAYVQGSSAELTNSSAIRLDNYFKRERKGKILSIIHDEFLFSLSDVSCIPNLVNIMEFEQLFNIPFLTDVEIAETY